MVLVMSILIGMVAFAVDAGWMVLAQGDLQSAADAAALAGAQQLLGQPTLNNASGFYNLTNGFNQYYAPGQTAGNKTAIVNVATAAAKASAKTYGGYHGAGTAKSLTILDSDIEFGTNSGGSYTALNSPYASFPNTIKVSVRLDATANNPLPLFFASIFGATTKALIATASATIYAGSINGFQQTPLPSRILPMGFDINDWNTFITTGQQPGGTTNIGSNGAPQVQVYPLPGGPDTGNFGLLSLDQGNDGASRISGWIDHGASASDISILTNAGLIPLSSHNPSKWDWEGNPGLKASDVHALAGHQGDTYLMALFTPASPAIPSPPGYSAGQGNGGNYYYNVVAFVPITISYVDNKTVSVQPGEVIDPNAIYTGAVPATSTAGQTLMPPKLTQ
jgi:Flp pilus assembly protein TadG